MSEVRRDGRERIDNDGARLLPCCLSGATTSKSHKKSKATVATLVLIMICVPQSTQAFGVVSSSVPRSMDNLVLGTVALPNVPSGDPNKLLNDAYERGFRRFDLARSYGGGKSEELFGKWMDENSGIEGGVNRDDIRIVTKGGMGNDKYGDPNRPLCTSSSLSSELHLSLDSLRTDYADLYMLHRDDPRIPVSSFVDWMNALIDDGLIRRWGVSNWSKERIEQAYNYAMMTEQNPPSATSPQLSLAVPRGQVWPTTESVSCETKRPDLDWYAKNNIEVMGWEALAKGFMAVPDLWSNIDRDLIHGPDAEQGSDLWRMQRIQRAYCTPENYERRRIAHALAEESGLTLAQVALLYSLSKGDHVSVLVGADCEKHLDEMAELKDYELDEEAVNCLTKAKVDEEQQQSLVYS